MMELSIIVCSKNRCQSLAWFLKSFGAEQVCDIANVELLVVDNGSTDDTKKICQEFESSYPGEFRYVFEPARGKSAALNAGLKVSRGQVIALTDDDCLPAPNWCREIVGFFSREPEIDFVGGRVELFDSADSDTSTVTFASRFSLNEDSKAIFRPAIIGANAAYRRRVFEKLGTYDTKLGPGSRFGAVSEDLDYLYRAWRTGFRIEYVPEIVVYHNHGRRSQAAFDSVTYGYSVGRGAFYAKHMFADREIMKRLMREIRRSFAGIVRKLTARQSIRTERRALAGMAVGAFSRLLPSD